MVESAPVHLRNLRNMHYDLAVCGHILFKAISLSIHFSGSINNPT